MNRRPCRITLVAGDPRGKLYADGWVDCENLHLQTGNVLLYKTAHHPLTMPAIIIPVTNVAAIVFTD